MSRIGSEPKDGDMTHTSTSSNAIAELIAERLAGGGEDLAPSVIRAENELPARVLIRPANGGGTVWALTVEGPFDTETPEDIVAASVALGFAKDADA